MQIDNVLLEIDSNIQNANIVKDIVLSQLVKDNVITNEQFSLYSENYQVVIFKKSWFKKWADKFSPNEQNTYIFKYLKFT